MAVQRVESYTTQSGDKVLKIILKPTKNFPEGKNFFFTDDNEITRELIESYTWCLHQCGKNIYVVAVTYGQVILRFHQEYAKQVLGYYSDYLDHINGLSSDNRDINLNIVNNQQNIRNRPTVGYNFDSRYNYFQPSYKLNNIKYYRGSHKTEPEALLATSHIREEVYSDYNYNFLEDRRNFEHLVDKEVKSIITHKEANYIRAKQLIESNPWYVYRYNLFGYCKENNIKIPEFKLDSQGFMIHPVTRERLCPY